jgi:hypothetical protein
MFLGMEETTWMRYKMKIIRMKDHLLRVVELLLEDHRDNIELKRKHQ